MRRGTPRLSEQNQSFDEEIGKISEQLPAVPGVKKFSINTKEYSNIFKMFARTIVAFFNVSSPYESYNTLNSQGEFAISEEGRSPWAPERPERE